MVSVTASWDEGATAKFKSSFRVRFENASLLSEGGGVTVYPDEGEPFRAAADNAYITEEIRTFIRDLAEGNLDNAINPATSARESEKLIETLRASAARGGEIIQL